MARARKPPDRSAPEEDDIGPEDPILDGAAPTCALCLRPIPADVPQSLHHLVPRSKGGKGGATVLLHDLCHREIHAALTEGELARAYSTPEALRAQPRLARFAEWVAARPAGFSSRVPRPERGRR